MIVVTGGTGLLGGHLLLELLKEQEEVCALIRPGGNPESVLSVWKHHLSDPATHLKGITWKEVDLNDRQSLLSVIPRGSYVYHCAGNVSFSPGDMGGVYRTNLEATRMLVDVCLEQDVAKLLHVSSIAAIGKNDNGNPNTEGEPWQVKKKRGYSDSKIQAELEVWRGIAEGLRAVIVNPAVILGAGRWTRSSARIFDTIYKGLKYYTRGVTGYVDAGDAAQAMVLLMKSDILSERFILSAENLSFEDLFKRVADALGVPAPKTYVGKGMSRLGWRLEKLRSMVTGKEPRLTRQSVAAAHAITTYSAEKFCKTFDFSFRPAQESIREIARAYLADCR